MASEFVSRLGAEVARRRREKDLTQEALASDLDTTKEWLSQVERGVGNPSVALIERMAWSLDTTVEVLLLSATRTATRSEVVSAIASVAERLSPRDARVLLALANELDRADEVVAPRKSRKSRRRQVGTSNRD